MFGGLGNDEPRGMSGRNVMAYDDWPAEVQEAFRFDPPAAAALLDEAGRPRGDDGVRFSLVGNICCPQVLNATYYELVASYLADIGIDLQLEFEEGANYTARMQSADYDLATSEGASQMIEEHLVGRFTVGYRGYPNTRDAGYEAKFKEMQAADSFEEWERLWGELNFFLIENHWVITAVEPPQWNVLQPWVQGWNGENMLGRHQYAELWARLWIGGMVLHGTFGTSLHGRTYRIEQIIARRLPITMELGLIALVIALTISLPVGVYSMRQDTADAFADPRRRAQLIADQGMVVLGFHSERHRETPVDLFATEPFDFNAEYAAPLVEEVAPGVPVRIVRLEALLRLKRGAGRPQDLADIAELTQLERGPGNS